MEDRVRNLEVAVKDLQAKMQDVLIMQATSTANMRHIDERLDKIGESQSRMEETANKAVQRIAFGMISVVALALAGFIFDGGFANVAGG